MNEKFSKGEWSLQGFPIGERDGKMAFANLEIVAPSQDGRFLNFCVGRVDFSPNHQGFMPCDLEEAEANARLFAASKKMLEALKTFVSATITDTGQIVGLMREDFDKARAAIAAATGEQQ